MSQDTTVTGAIAELMAAQILMQMGFEVFRNVSPRGPHDLVIVERGSFHAILIDVTVGRWNTLKNGTKMLYSQAPSKLRKEKAQTVLVVTDDGQLFKASFDLEAGLYYNVPNGYQVKYELVTAETFKHAPRPETP